MPTITIHKAKTQLSKLIEQVERGEEIVIARGKTPVARLVPYVREQAKRGFGSMKGRATIGPEFREPLPEEELKLWERRLAVAAAAGHPTRRSGGATATLS
jgi:prevent-host-death family protein